MHSGGLSLHYPAYDTHELYVDCTRSGYKGNKVNRPARKRRSFQLVDNEPNLSHLKYLTPNKPRISGGVFWAQVDNFYFPTGFQFLAATIASKNGTT